MKFTVRSKKYGDFEVLVDDEDVEKICEYRFRILKSKYSFYVKGINLQGKLIYLHRLIMDAPPGVGVDHRFGDTLDNRKSQLRFATNGQNSQNRRKIKTRSKNASKFKGVCWEEKARKWKVRCSINGKETYIGLFVSEIEAAKAYDAASKKHYGEFALLNFPDDVVPTDTVDADKDKE